MAWFWGREFPTMKTKNSVVTVKWLTRSAEMPSALRLSAAFAMVRTRGASGSSSGLAVKVSPTNGPVVPSNHASRWSAVPGLGFRVPPRERLL